MLIRCDGSTEVLEGPVSLSEIHRLIGTSTLDFVGLYHMGDPLHVMAVDDNGYETRAEAIEGGVFLRPVRALKPVNLQATALYHRNCAPGTTHQIVGDVVIVPDEDYK